MTRRVEVRTSANYTDYVLLSPVGTVDARISSENWGDRFRPTVAQALAAFSLLCPGAVFSVREVAS